MILLYNRLLYKRFLLYFRNVEVGTKISDGHANISWTGAARPVFFSVWVVGLSWELRLARRKIRSVTTYKSTLAGRHETVGATPWNFLPVFAKHINTGVEPCSEINFLDEVCKGCSSGSWLLYNGYWDKLLIVTILAKNCWFRKSLILWNHRIMWQSVIAAILSFPNSVTISEKHCSSFPRLSAYSWDHFLWFYSGLGICYI